MADTVDDSGISASWKDVANAGTTPRIDATLVTGAGTTGNKYWRSEIVLRSAAQIGGPKPDYVQMQAGDTIDVDFSLRTFRLRGAALRSVHNRIPAPRADTRRGMARATVYRFRSRRVAAVRRRVPRSPSGWHHTH